MRRRNSNKLGHQAPKGWRHNLFTSIEIEGDFAHCESHNFVYNSEIEEEKLYNAQPCYYTDKRFYDGAFNFSGNCKLYWRRREPISLRSCVRRTMNCKGIPVGTIVSFQKDWYYPGKRLDLSYAFKVKKDNPIDIQYQVSHPSYFKNFNTCEFSKNLTDKLRENGFLVSVQNKNPDFIMGMIKTAAAYTGQVIDKDDDDGGEIAVAYGHGKIIGFSSGKNSFRGYSDGCENILYDYFGEFDKWSRCNWIKKGTDIDEIIKKLKESKSVFSQE